MYIDIYNVWFFCVYKKLDIIMVWSGKHIYILYIYNDTMIQYIVGYNIFVIYEKFNTNDMMIQLYICYINHNTDDYI